MPDFLSSTSNDNILLSPSILSADFAKLGEDVISLSDAGAEMVHIDVLDGHFAPNLSMGPAIVKCIRPHTQRCLDVHLMITNPSKYSEPFIKAGANNVTIHVEIDEDISSILKSIKSMGASCGISIKPETPAEEIKPYLELVDMVLVMTVNPGFSGQKFIPEMTNKIAQVRELIKASGRNIHIQVDGGVDDKTGIDCVSAGANVIVAASAIFGAEDGIHSAVNRIRTACEETKKNA